MLAYKFNKLRIQYYLYFQYEFCQTVVFPEVSGISSNLLSSRSLQTSLEEKFMFLLKVIKAGQNKYPRYTCIKSILTKCNNILSLIELRSLNLTLANITQVYK